MDIRVEYSAASCIVLALMCLVLPLDWMLAAITAAVFHELCHMAAVLLSGGNIHSLRFGVGGAIMETAPMEPWKELICVLAGPVGSFSLLLVAKMIPKTALCGLVQGGFNLLPLYPLDGGRALHCLAGMLFSPSKAARFCSWVKYAFLFLIMAAGIYGSFALELGFLPAFVALFLLSRTLRGKIPCKEGKLGVQ